MPTDLFRVHFICFTDEPDGIRQQDAAFCFLRFVLLPLFIFIVRDLFNGGYPVKLEFVSSFLEPFTFLIKTASYFGYSQWL